MMKVRLRGTQLGLLDKKFGNQGNFLILTNFPNFLNMIDQSRLINISKKKKEPSSSGDEVLLVDAENGFDLLNCRVALHNIQYSCPVCPQSLPSCEQAFHLC